MAWRAQLLSIGLTIATSMASVLAATSGDMLVASEVVRGESALTVVRCTYVRGLRSETLHFVVTPEGSSHCAWSRRRAAEQSPSAGHHPRGHTRPRG